MLIYYTTSQMSLSTGFTVYNQERNAHYRWVHICAWTERICSSRRGWSASKCILTFRRINAGLNVCTYDEKFQNINGRFIRLNHFESSYIFTFIWEFFWPSRQGSSDWECQALNWRSIIMFDVHDFERPPLTCLFSKTNIEAVIRLNQDFK